MRKSISHNKENGLNKQNPYLNFLVLNSIKEYNILYSLTFLIWCDCSLATVILYGPPNIKRLPDAARPSLKFLQ